MHENNWDGFKKNKWSKTVDVRDFIISNYTPYEGDSSFLSGPSNKTKKVWEKAKKLLEQETKNHGVLEVGNDRAQNLLAYDAGYIDKENEVIVGLQTDKPLKRGIYPKGGIRVVAGACQDAGVELPKDIWDTFTIHAKTHNQGVFDAYTNSIKNCRHSHIITGLPDSYGRGRIIGDYRRVALYGVDSLIQDKKEQFESLEVLILDEDIIRRREEVTDQINALKDLKEMAQKYGFDISHPAKNATEAVQWTYFGYLGAIKEQDGAAMSLGRVSTFLDVYIERDIANGILNEEQAQELIDQLVIKLRLVRFLRRKDYSKIFSGDPTWVTESIGGIGQDGRTMVTKTSFRMLQTLYNLGPAPEPNLTILYSKRLPEPFKRFCAKVSIDTDSIQYENDELMRYEYGDDYGIACCVSAMRIGEQMQFFGARCNLAKTLLYALNEGRDEITGEQISLKCPELKGEYLDYDAVMENFNFILDWLLRVYVNALNVIHYMHDKYAYERLQMALHDRDVIRTMATGIAGLSVVADSLSAIKYAKVKAIRNEDGLTTGFEIEGDYPKFGNNDNRVDYIASHLQRLFMQKLKKYKCYRDAKPTMSILTITSNVMYGENTGATPDGRKLGEPFAPGANPMHRREHDGALAAMKSLGKLDYEYSQDGISYTFSIAPQLLGGDDKARVDNLVQMLDAYFADGGHHININVLNRKILEDAMEHPEQYPQLTIRVSGYAVNFVKLSREHQLEVLSRTFYGDNNGCRCG